VSECLFCAIVAGDIPADVVLRTDDVVAFRDIAPQAPLHVLVIPTRHVPNVRELAELNPQLAGLLLQAAGEVAQQEGAGTDFRLVFNTGAGAGQSVFHAHGHVLAGRGFDWPPG